MSRDVQNEKQYSEWKFEKTRQTLGGIQALLNGSSAQNRLLIYEKTSGIQFLSDSGAGTSILPVKYLLGDKSASKFSL